MVLTIFHFRAETDKLLLDGSLSDYQFTKNSNKTIPDVDDASDFNALLDSMQIMEFKELEIFDILRVVATLLHLGNVKPVPGRDDQAELVDTAAAERACHLMGIPLGAFVKAILKPQIKAGRETVTQHRTCEQVVYSIEALSRATYERLFSWLIERVNLALDRPSPKNKFIGVLDIAGFEIFQVRLEGAGLGPLDSSIIDDLNLIHQVNSFEQLLINYTNEKLQQFFNHHMFVLEQEEYRRENIEWRFIDFGLDLQPTIDLIEKANVRILMLCCRTCSWSYSFLYVLSLSVYCHALMRNASSLKQPIARLPTSSTPSGRANQPSTKLLDFRGTRLFSSTMLQRSSTPPLVGLTRTRTRSTKASRRCFRLRRNHSCRHFLPIASRTSRRFKP